MALESFGVAKMGLALHVCLGLLSIQIVKTAAVNFLGLESGMMDVMLEIGYDTGTSVDLPVDEARNTHPRRIRRYVHNGHRAPAYHLTWTFINNDDSLYITAIRQIKPAFDLWEKTCAPITFEEVNSTDAHIKIHLYSSEKRKLRKSIQYDESTNDIHLNFNQRYIFWHWSYVVRDESVVESDINKYNLTVAVAHSIGHLLGLDHSNMKGSIMESSSLNKENKILLDDDCDGVKALYGKVNPCKAKRYDAISMLDNEIVIFIGRFFWHKNKIMYPKKMQNEYENFPGSIRKIDAFYIDSEGRHIIFSNNLYYVYIKKILQPDNPKKLTELGLPKWLEHINAILLMNDMKNPFVISDDDYWILDSKSLLVIGKGTFNDWPGYPGPINTGFRYIDGRTYVFRKNSVWVVEGNAFVKLKEAENMTASEWVCNLLPITMPQSSIKYLPYLITLPIVVIVIVLIFLMLKSDN